ncbi:MAG TPA: class I SAM-dependent methyltransferase [Usitatibacter sp.]|nr:class I SAM-dependent methyltransferase [Usitatibacter sp.]
MSVAESTWDPVAYARARPTYPDELFAFLAAQAPARKSAWDCATGNGQAATGLARHFERVEATDVSADQVAHARAAPNVRYSVQPGEATTFADASFDAVCVAEALHWLEVDRFYAEARRVLRDGGVIAIIGYSRQRVGEPFDGEFHRIVTTAVKPHFPRQIGHLWGRYKDLAFPFEPVAAPAFEMRMRWSLAQLMDYVGTWSGTRALMAIDPEFLGRALEELGPAWGSEPSRDVVFPLTLNCGRKA